MTDPDLNPANRAPSPLPAVSRNTSAENLKLYRAHRPSYHGRHLADETKESISMIMREDGQEAKAVENQDDDDASEVRVEASVSTTTTTTTTQTTKTTVAATTTRPRRRRFGDVKFAPHTSILEDDASKTSIFAGFYTPFWLGTFVLFARTMTVNYRTTGYLLPTHIVRILWRDIFKIGLTDLVFFLLTFANVAIQKLVAARVLRWRSGLILQSLYELGFFVLSIWWPMYRGYPWIGRVFLCLHSLVLLMKQHSYAFVCGYLSDVRDNLVLFESALRGLQEEETKDGEDDNADQNKLLEEIEFCKSELRSTLGGSVVYPENLTMYNFFDYMMMPTLLYELEYPRTQRIRWGYVFEKLAAIFGVFFLMIMVAEQYFYPVVMHALSLRALPFTTKALEYPALLLELIMPFMLMYLLTWYLIWEAILNEIAELTCFADRYFYGPWWNSVQWDQFARDWNVPVHMFLLRHVYHSSISAFKVSKHAATFFTFFLSSLVHELVMFVIFKKLRGYLLVLQMLQLPLVQLSKTALFRDNEVFGRIIFWFGIYTGPSMMCMLYLTF
ncbi:MBOAT, membrane-bound O-acyltransferase family-domain-containing protein [Limtongia smithiae]|uniref:MBOAT, membrane-bound O-acyltransferase family-domain-containing protein n=1 Tax=Limtongia smithiae TaxID=1125753 RepID=UPI0034CFFF4F